MRILNYENSLGGGFKYLAWCSPTNGFKYVFCSSLLGEMIQFDDHIFQMGWFNHQLVHHHKKQCHHQILDEYLGLLEVPKIIIKINGPSSERDHGILVPGHPNTFSGGVCIGCLGSSDLFHQAFR